LNPYEQKQWEAIEQWKSSRPNVAGELGERALYPFARWIDRWIPKTAVRVALESAVTAGRWLADIEQIRRRAGLPSLALLQDAPLETCDLLAQSVRKEAMAWAAAEGGLTGAAGLPGIFVDMPAVAVMALRAIHRTAACYGIQLSGREGEAIAFEILRAGGANTLSQKREALGALHGWVRAGTPGLRELATALLAHRLVGDAARHLIGSMTREMGLNLAKRKLLQVVPIAGAAIGAGINAWYLRDICLAAQRTFQERHLHTLVQNTEEPLSLSGEVH
jgi:hypothetical protein